MTKKDLWHRRRLVYSVYSASREEPVCKKSLPPELLAEYSEPAAQAAKKRSARTQVQDAPKPVENLTAAVSRLKKALNAR